jgi:hypothetical protein
MLKKDKEPKKENKSNVLLWGLGIWILVVIIALIIKAGCGACREDANNTTTKENEFSQINPGNCLVVETKDKQTAQQELIEDCKRYTCSRSEEIKCSPDRCCWFFNAKGNCQKAVCYMR